MKRPFLLLIGLIALFILINISSFIDNVWFYATGSVVGLTIKDSWMFVGLNVLFFLSLVFLVGRRTVDWKAKGAFSAFIISLFIEMYGAPLSLYFVQNQLFGSPEITPESHNILFNLNFLGVNLGFDFWMVTGGVIITLGIGIIVLGWYQLWSSKKELFTDGLYKYSRHPQYIGFLLIVWGWMIAWPTLLTILMAPFLTYAYLNAAKKEEEHISKSLKGYKEYKKNTPFFV